MSGCSDGVIKCKNGDIVSFRSMDYPIGQDAKVIISTKGKTYKSKTPDGTYGLEWTSEVGFVGCIAFDVVVDGINEHGLSFAALVLDITQYPPYKNSSRSIGISYLGPWILQFKNIAEIKIAIKDVHIWDNRTLEGLTTTPGLHIAVHDSEGNNLVIEFINGETLIYDNPNGVLTNDPPFQSQLDYLLLYSHLNNGTPTDAIESCGNISTNMIGLPGDFSPITRFVRASIGVKFSTKAENSDDALPAARAILNMVQIPKGLLRMNGHDLLTRWSVFRDHNNRKIYYNSWSDNTLKLIDLNKICFEPLIEYHPILIDHPIKQNYIDVTERFVSPNATIGLYNKV